MMDSVIQFEGTIYENGYGLLAQKVMRDKTLPKQSKLIYAYMCSFASVGKDGARTAFPSVALQCAELGMSENTYYTWRKYLVDKGYIKITKQREKGQFDRNLYSIIAVPIEVKVDETIDTKGKEPYPKKQGTGKTPYPKNSSTVNSSMENKGTNINSFNINSFNKEEEEEEEITLGEIIQFINEQIAKREITNSKTITAIFEVADKCRAINTTDRDAMKNYCIKVIEEKMSKLGQKQKNKNVSNKKSNSKEMLPEWFEENQQQEQPKKENMNITDAKARKKDIEEKLKQLRDKK
jgi:hypothetical protein